MTRCPYCQSGRIAVEPGSSLFYHCPDCTPTTGTTGYNLLKPGEVYRFDSRDCDDFEPNESETKDP